MLSRSIMQLTKKARTVPYMYLYLVCTPRAGAQAGACMQQMTAGARIASGLAQFRNNKSPGLRHTLPPSTPPLGSANGLRPSGSDLQQQPPMLRRQHTSVNDAFHGTDTNHTQRNGEKFQRVSPQK